MEYYGFDPVLTIIAVLPAVYLLIQVYKADKLDKEPRGLLISLIFWGILSTAIAVILEGIGQYILSPLDPRSIIYNVILYFVIVGFAEEWGKYIVMKLRTWKHPAFNCQFDGVVYAVFVSLGFALWENIQYVGIYGFETAIVRAFTAIPGHASFAVFMGVWYGMAKRHEYAGNFAKARQCRRLAVIIPALIHGAYDFIATMGGGGLSILFIVFIVGMFIWASRLVKTLSKNDRYIGYQGPRDQ